MFHASGLSYWRNTTSLKLFGHSISALTHEWRSEETHKVVEARAVIWCSLRHRRYELEIGRKAEGPERRYETFDSKNGKIGVLLSTNQAYRGPWITFCNWPRSHLTLSGCQRNGNRFSTRRTDPGGFVNRQFFSRRKWSGSLSHLGQYQVFARHYFMPWRPEIHETQYLRWQHWWAVDLLPFFLRRCFPGSDDPNAPRRMVVQTNLPRNGEPTGQLYWQLHVCLSGRHILKEESEKEEANWSLLTARYALLIHVMVKYKWRRNYPCVLLHGPHRQQHSITGWSVTIEGGLSGISITIRKGAMEGARCGIGSHQAARLLLNN